MSPSWGPATGLALKPIASDGCATTRLRPVWGNASRNATTSKVGPGVVAGGTSAVIGEFDNDRWLGHRPATHFDGHSYW